jgi:hypothetical protein
MLKKLVAVFIYWLGYSIGYIKTTWKWCPWSPWTIAKLNMTWSHYVKTPMYERRVEFDKEIKGNGSFPQTAFVENREYAFFVRHITKKEWLKIIFTPFSCTGIFQLPTWRIKRWWFGEAE